MSCDAHSLSSGTLHLLYHDACADPLAAQDSATGAIRGTVLDSTGSRIAAGLDRRRQHRDRHALHGDQRLPRAASRSTCCRPATTPRASWRKACRRRSRPSCTSMSAAAAELEFRLTIAGAHENVTVSGAPALVETKPSAVSTLLDERAAERFPAQRPPLLRSRAVLARRHAGSAQPHVGHQRRSLFRRHSRIPEHLSGRRPRLQQCLLRAGPRTLSRALSVLHRSRAGVPRLVQFLRRRAGTLRRRGRQRRHQVRLESRARHRVLLSCATVRSARPNPFLAFKPHNRQQQVGGTIGGPLKRNKIFFFAGFDQHIFHVPNVVEFLDGSSQVVPQAGTGPTRPATTRPPIKPWSSPPPPNSLRSPGNIPPHRSATLPTPSSTSISRPAINSRCA